MPQDTKVPKLDESAKLVGQPKDELNTNNISADHDFSVNLDIKSRAPYISVLIGINPENSMKIMALKDSGAAFSIIRKSVFDSLPLSSTVTPTTFENKYVGTADITKRTQVYGVVTLSLTFTDSEGKSLTIPSPMYLIDNLSEHAIIGHNILHSPLKHYETRDVLALKSSPDIKIEIPDQDHIDLFKIPILYNNEKANQPHIQNVQGIALEDTVLPGLSTMTIPMKIPCSTDSLDLYVHESQQLPYMVVPESVQKSNDGSSYLSITNYNKYPLFIKTHEPLANLHTIDELNEAHLNNISSAPIFATALDDDPYMSKTEKDNALQDFQNSGIANTSASHIIDKAPCLTSFEHKPKITYSLEERIKGIDVSHLTLEEQVAAQELFSRKLNVLARDPFDIQHTDVIEAHIELKPNSQLMQSKYVPIPWSMHEEATELLEYYIAKDVIRICDEPTPFVSCMLFSRKKSGKIRALLDARILNYNCQKLAVSVSSVQEIQSFLSQKTHLSVIDLSNAYFHIPISDDTCKYTAFLDHRRRKLCFKSCPQGYINSAFYLDHLLARLLSDIPEAKWFADDVIIATNGSYATHLKAIGRVCDRLIQGKLRIQHSKVSLCKEYTEFLGIIYRNDGSYKIPEARLSGYLKLPPPQTSKLLTSFLCSLSFYRRLIRDFARITEPLHDIAKTSSKSPKAIKWSPDLTQAFENTKTALKTASAMNLPKQGLPYKCYSDASNVGIGFVVCQIDKNNTEIPVCFLSKLFTSAERNYSTYRKEVVALLYGMTQMSYFFTDQIITVVTDCRSILFLKSAKDSSSFLTRAALALSKYQIRLLHIPGTENVTADYLSCSQAPPSDLTDIKPLSEKESVHLIEKLCIPQNFTLSPDMVKSLLLGDSPTKRSAANSRQRKSVVSCSPRDSLPTLKPERKIKMPRLIRGSISSIGDNNEEATISVVTRSATREREQVRDSDASNDAMTGPNNNSSHRSMADQASLSYNNTNNTNGSSKPPPKDGDKGTSGQTYPLDVIHYKSKIIASGTLPLKDFSIAQWSDPELEPLMTSLTNGDRKKNFKLIDGILLHMLHNTPRLVIPNSLMTLLMQTYHDSIHAAHPSACQMYKNVSKSYFHKNLRQEIYKYVEGCAHCITSSTFHKPKHTFQGSFQAYCPRAVWCMDLAHGFPTTSRGNSSIILFVDYFSLYTVVAPIKGKTQGEILNAIRTHIITPFGPPAALRCDRESAVVRSHWNQAYLDSLNIRLLATAPASPFSNGVCELHVKATKTLVRKVTSQLANSTDWDENLLPIQLSINRYNRLRGYSSEQIMFGISLPRPDDVIQICDSPLTLDNPALIMQRADNIRKLVDEHRQQVKENAANRQNAARKTHQYVSGQLVYVQNQTIQQHGALVAKFKGPYVIDTVDNNGQTVLLRDIHGGPTFKEHKIHLRPLHQPLQSTKLNTGWDKILKRELTKQIADLQIQSHRTAADTNQQASVIYDDLGCLTVSF